jgi:hypothetical protein
MLLLEAPRMQHYCKVGWLSGYALHRINNSLTKDHENTIECQNKIWLKMTYKIFKHERQSSSTQIYNRPFPQTNYQDAVVGHGQLPHARPCLNAQSKAARDVSNGSRATAGRQKRTHAHTHTHTHTHTRRQTDGLL